MNDTANIWIAEDDASIRWVMEKALVRSGLSVSSYDTADKLLQELESCQPDAIISDVRMPGTDGLSLLRNVHQRFPKLPVIITTAHSDLDSAVSAYQGGAFEYLPKPFDIDELSQVTQRAVQFTREQRGDDDDDAEPESNGIIGEAPAMQEVFRAIGRLSHSNITVLINGESGTGKELVAHALHAHSPRASQPFIALNMAAIPSDLIESELFGHEKGAFTGAGQKREGRFEQANGGTLFLDEIGDMPAEAQTRLLRVLAEGEFYRVGGMTPIKVNVRIIAATHQNLEGLVAQGKFREDLFHRLNVIRVHIPALRERREDIPRLARYFLQRAAKELSEETKQLTPGVEQFLCQLEWPGNVRQLENTCRWLTVMAAGRDVQLEDLPPEMRNQQPVAAVGDWEQALRQWVERALASGTPEVANVLQPRFEALLIETALKYTSGRKRDAAEKLGWGRNTLTRKLQELGLEQGE